MAEVVAAGITEVTVEDFPDYLERLEHEEAEVTRLEHEFQLLETHRTEPHRFASATRECNKEKNRFYNLMPCEQIPWGGGGWKIINLCCCFSCIWKMISFCFCVHVFARLPPLFLILLHCLPVRVVVIL